MQLVVVLGVVAVLAGWAGAVEPCPLTFSNSLDSTSDSSEFVGNWYAHEVEPVHPPNSQACWRAD